MSLNDSSAIILIIGALAVIAFVFHGLWFSGKSANRRLNKSSETDQVLQNSTNVGKVRIVSGTNTDDTSHFDKKTVKIQDTHAFAPEKQKTITNEVKTIRTEENPIKRPPEIYEINVESETERPFMGTQIEELFNELGFMRSKNSVYICPESMDQELEKSAVVFRICSLKKPFSFPEDMQNYETNALAFYMTLPETGKGEVYFNCMRCAAQEFADRLGGKLLDTSGEPLTDQKMDEIASLLHEYDAPSKIEHVY